MQDRIRGLDALRGIAAMSVVFYHYTVGYAAFVGPHNSNLLMTASYGFFGVHLFFIISGFVILRTLERCHGLVDFAVSRFARLYPAFFVASCLALCVIFALDFNPQSIGARDILASFTMVSDFLSKKLIDPSYWTLGYEVLFYALAGITYLAFGVRRIEVACLVWLAIGVSGNAIRVAHHGVSEVAEGLWSYLFVLGMMIYSVSRRRATMLTGITIAAVLAVGLTIPINEAGYLSRPVETAAVAMLGLLVWAAVEGKLPILTMLPLLFLGDISYSLYLVHQIGGYVVIRHLEMAGINANLAIAAAFGAMLLVATALRYGIELPAQRVIKSAMRHRFGSRIHVGTPSAIVDEPA